MLPAQLQRGFREDKILGNRDVLDYLKEVGVDRVQCLLVYGKASEALFWTLGSDEARQCGSDLADFALHILLNSFLVATHFCMSEVYK